jgi:hypothetical protein
LVGENLLPTQVDRSKEIGNGWMKWALSPCF